MPALAAIEETTSQDITTEPAEGGVTVGREKIGRASSFCLSLGPEPGILLTTLPVIFGALEGKIFSSTEAAGDLQQDFGIRARFSRRGHSLSDTRYTTLGGGHSAFLFFVQRTGENDVRVMCGFV